MRETSLRRRALRLLAVCSLVLAAGSGLSAQSGDLRLVEAVKRQDTVAVRVLVSEADVNATQADGATALHWAAYRDDLATARLLIGAGADAGVSNELGVTPLDLACENANPAMVELLLKEGWM